MRLPAGLTKRRFLDAQKEMERTGEVCLVVDTGKRTFFIFRGEKPRICVINNNSYLVQGIEK